MNSSPWQKAAQYALICAMIVFASKLLFYLTDFIFVFFGLVGLLLIAVIFVVSFSVVMMNWKKSREEITYGDAFKFGLMILAIYVVIMFGLDLLFAYVIAPNYNQQVIDHTMSSMAKMNVPADKLDETREKMEKSMSVSTIKASLFAMGGRAVFDVIVLLIVAAVARKEKEFK